MGLFKQSTFNISGVKLMLYYLINIWIEKYIFHILILFITSNLCLNVKYKLKLIIKILHSWSNKIFLLLYISIKSSCFKNIHF